MAWRRRDVRAHEFALDHPDWAARLTRWAQTARHRWERLTRTVQAAATAFARRVGDRARRAAVPWPAGSAAERRAGDGAHDGAGSAGRPRTSGRRRTQPDAATVPCPSSRPRCPPGERPALISGGGSTP